MKSAFITGITGQDGSYLTELLLSNGYQVYGLMRRKSEYTTSRIDHLLNNPNVKILYGDITDASTLDDIIATYHPNEIYNLAAQSFVGESWKEPVYTCNVDGMGVLNLLESIRKIDKSIKFYQASTSEMYGTVKEIPQNEQTPFNPNSPYAAAKVFAYYLTKVYRESYNMFACNGILFNHESSRRGTEFVTRKITMAVAKIKQQLTNNETVIPLSLGNIYTRRDWGYAGDYVNAMYLMLQQDKPDDFVIASGESHTVKEFINLAFKFANIDIQWVNTIDKPSLDEYAIDSKTGNKIVTINKDYFRLNDVPLLVGDPSKAKQILNWKTTVNFEALVKMMVEFDLSLIQR
ncbi:MAG: GDP-mannose 4,6-dehydratase [Candidatus Micrarchaeaceae archaeon]